MFLAVHIQPRINVQKFKLKVNHFVGFMTYDQYLHINIVLLASKGADPKFFDYNSTK